MNREKSHEFKHWYCTPGTKIEFFFKHFTKRDFKLMMQHPVEIMSPVPEMTQLTQANSLAVLKN